MLALGVQAAAWGAVIGHNGGHLPTVRSSFSKPSTSIGAAPTALLATSRAVPSPPVASHPPTPPADAPTRPGARSPLHASGAAVLESEASRAIPADESSTPGSRSECYVGTEFKRCIVVESTRENGSPASFSGTYEWHPTRIVAGLPTWFKRGAAGAETLLALSQVDSLLHFLLRTFIIFKC